MANETIREKVSKEQRIEYILQDLIDGKYPRVTAWRAILELYPRWKSFKDELPEEGEDIAIRAIGRKEWYKITFKKDAMYLYSEDNFEWYKIPTEE